MMAPLKVRVGFGLGVRTELYDERFGHVVDELERLDFDSLWLSERLGTRAPDPLAAMGVGLGRTRRLKFGMSVLVVPGRNPVVLAKALASLATLSGGRVLPAFGMGAASAAEHRGFGVDPAERAARLEEAIAVMRACWTGRRFDFDGEFFHYEAVKVLPTPARMDVWLGGEAPSTLRRIGRIADGWLPSFISPDDALAGRRVIERTAAEVGREIEPDHYGVLIPYTSGPIPDAMLELLATRKPDVDVAEIVPVGWSQLVDLIGRFIDAGTSKFVVLPLEEPTSPAAWSDHLERAAEVLRPLET